LPKKVGVSTEQQEKRIVPLVFSQPLNMRRFLTDFPERSPSPQGVGRA